MNQTVDGLRRSTSAARFCQLIVVVLLSPAAGLAAPGARASSGCGKTPGLEPGEKTCLSRSWNYENL